MRRIVGHLIAARPRLQVRTRMLLHMCRSLTVVCEGLELLRSCLLVLKAMIRGQRRLWLMTGAIAVARSYKPASLKACTCGFTKRQGTDVRLHACSLSWAHACRTGLRNMQLRLLRMMEEGSSLLSEARCMLRMMQEGPRLLSEP